jgi:hypothetical protein
MLLRNLMKDNMIEVVYLLDHSLEYIHYNCKNLISR